MLLCDVGLRRDFAPSPQGQNSLALKKVIKMNGLDFEQLRELNIGDVQDLEKEFPKIQGFLYNSEKNTLKKVKEENFAEKLVEGLECQ